MIYEKGFEIKYLIVVEIRGRARETIRGTMLKYLNNDTQDYIKYDDDTILTCKYFFNLFMIWMRI